MRWHEPWRLSTRLIALSLFAAWLCTSVGGWVMRTQLHEVVLRSGERGLQDHTERLLAELQTSGTSALRNGALDQGAFGQIFSGWYWMVQQGEQTWRSRSLWDDTLNLNRAQPLPQRAGLSRLTDPRNEPILGQRTDLTLDGQAARLYVFVPLQEIESEWRRIDQILLLTQGGFLLAVIGWTIAQVQLGLAPLRRLQQALQAVHAGRSDTLSGDYGPDLAPIAQSMNDVLHRNAQVVARARHQAADLSHALKKPLAQLSLQAQAEHVPGPLLREQVQTMSDSIDRHLARFASGAGSKQVIDVVPVLQRVLTLMRQIHGERALQWEATLPPTLRWQGASSDLEEMAGNLLDNAGKWAHSRVHLQLHPQDKGWTLCVADDGPGLSPTQQETSIQRGRRFDEQVPGHGLGLAIVQDIAETYGGVLRLQVSPQGGLAAHLSLP